MKLKNIFYGILGVLFCMACTDEEKIIPGNEGFKLRFDFPQGANEWDKTAQEIQEKYGVHLIYKNIDSTHLRKTWSNINSKYVGESLTDDQAARHIQFLKEHVFAYLPSDVVKKGLPLYYYLVYDYRNSTESKAHVFNTLNGVDYWVNSIFYPGQLTISTKAKCWEQRYRMIKCIIENLCSRNIIVASKDFHSKFDYTTAINTYLPNDVNYFLKRGFPGTTNGDRINISEPWSITEITQFANFVTYINLGMLYSPAELEAKYPKATYSKIHTQRDYIVKYMKEKYNIDLEAIYQGPEI